MVKIVSGALFQEIHFFSYPQRHIDPIVFPVGYLRVMVLIVMFWLSVALVSTVMVSDLVIVYHLFYKYFYFTHLCILICLTAAGGISRASKYSS